MSSKVTRELLFRAYPDGFLAMKGVTTIGGWHCLGGMGWIAAPGSEVGSRSEARHSYRHVLHESLTVDRNIHTGDLLPNLDPVGDPATWACALRDLAEALGNPTPWATSYGWWRDIDDYWVLRSQGAVLKDRTVKAFPDLDTDDPAEALCLARASLRKEVKS